MRKEALLRRGGALIRSWGRGLAEILYPEGAVCLGCGRLSDGECLCPACREELRYSDVLDSWQLRDIGGVPVWCMRPHRDLPRKLVLRLKHGTEARAAKAMAGMLRDRPDYFLHPAPGTVVTWVPGPKGRIRERCIDHGKRLAEAVAAELGLECRPLLIRKKSTLTGSAALSAAVVCAALPKRQKIFCIRKWQMYVHRCLQMPVYTNRHLREGKPCCVSLHPLAIRKHKESASFARKRRTFIR